MSKDHGPEAQSSDLGGFAPGSFENVNRKAGGFQGETPARAMGKSEISPAGETDADAALAKIGGMAERGRSDKTSSGAAKLPTEAGGPLPQGTPTGR